MSESTPIRMWRRLLNQADELEVDGHRTKAIEIAERVAAEAAAERDRAVEDSALWTECTFVMSRAQALLAYVRRGSRSSLPPSEPSDGC